MPQDEQREIVARGEKEILQAAKQIRAQKVEQKRAVKIAETDKLRELGSIRRRTGHLKTPLGKRWRRQLAGRALPSVLLQRPLCPEPGACLILPLRNR